MIFPSTRQIAAQTGQRVAPDYGSYISGYAQQLPTLMALRDQQRYQNQMQNLEEKSLKQNQNQFDLNFALQQKAMDNERKAQKTGNILQMLGLAGAGVNALNQFTDGGVAKWGGQALQSVMPEATNWRDTVTDGAASSGIMSQLSRGAGNVWDTASDVVSDYVVDPVSDYIVQPFVDYVAEPVAEGATKLWDTVSDSGVGTAISSWVDSLWG
jgi:hypothetical protein